MSLMSTSGRANPFVPATSTTVTPLVSTVLAIVVTRAAVDQVPAEGLTISVLFSGADPYAQMSLATSVPLALGRSAALGVAALIIAVVFGTALAILASETKSRASRSVLWVVGTAGVALPTFFWAALLQLGVVVVFMTTGTHIAPTSGVGFDDHLVLPALALAARPTAYVFRTVATAFGEVRKEDFVRSAIAKGLSGTQVSLRHVIPNVEPTLVGSMLLAARMVASGLLIVEYVFGWPGAGLGFVAAVARRDTAFATAIALGFVGLFSMLSGLSRAASERWARRAYGE